MESLNYFTSSRGLLKSCISHNLNPVSSSGHIDSNLLESHTRGGTIYVCTNALINFSENYLELLDSPFKLVTGDSDEPINNLILQHDTVKKILDHPLLIKWYAQNMVADHPKLHSLPIGMDYHTMWEHPGVWGLVKQSPIAQERALINILSNSPDLENRIFAGYCNWHFAIDRGDRRECLDQIDKSISLIEKNHLPRISSWQRQAECMFVVSPEGAGIDCHRTWEALLLGCIPVVKTNKLSKLFEELPVVVIDEWNDFNSEFMIQQLNILRMKKFDFSQLFSAYWRAELNHIHKFQLPHMTLKEFKNFICKEAF